MADALVMTPEEIEARDAKEEAARERRNERARKKRAAKAARKYVPKMPHKLVVFRNEDKDCGNWSESWRKPKNRNIGMLPHSFRLLALGAVSRGKSNTLKNLFLTHQGSSRPFRELYICTCSLQSKEWLDLDPTGIMNELPGVDFFNPKLKTCLIIDDFELTRLSTAERRKLSTLFRFVSSHRNVSIMLGYQSFFDVNPIARKCANVFLVYRPTSIGELNTIANRVGLSADDINYIFDHICTGAYDSLMVDNSVGSPARLRKNVYEVIELEGTAAAPLPTETVEVIK